MSGRPRLRAGPTLSYSGRAHRLTFFEGTYRRNSDLLAGLDEAPIYTHTIVSSYGALSIAGGFLVFHVLTSSSRVLGAEDFTLQVFD